MSSFRSYFGKKHKYETLADLIKERPTPEEIIRTDPKDIRTDILAKHIGPPLTKQQNKALLTLLSIKKQEKMSGVDLEGRERAIRQFLQFQPQVDALIAQTTGEIVKETNKLLEQQIEQKDLENRLRALRDEPPIPYTPEESLYKRQLELRKGGKRTRKYRKNSRKYKKRSSIKNKKRSIHKRKH